MKLKKMIAAAVACTLVVASTLPVLAAEVPASCSVPGEQEIMPLGYTCDAAGHVHASSTYEEHTQERKIIDGQRYLCTYETIRCKWCNSPVKGPYIIAIEPVF